MWERSECLSFSYSYRAVCMFLYVIALSFAGCDKRYRAHSSALALSALGGFLAVGQVFVDNNLRCVV